MKTGKFVALKYRDFRLLWVGLLISNIGSQMQFAAINWHIFLLTKSPLALGFIGLARFLPIAVFSLIGGTIADAHNRKKILFLTQITLTLLSLLLAVATLKNLVAPMFIYAMTALSAVAIAFDSPPRQALVPSLVSREHLPNALSLNVIMFQTSTVVGPALAGIVIAQFGVGAVYFFNAISFLAVIGALFLMKTSGEIEGVRSKVSLKAIIEGLAFVKSRTIIWSTMVLDFFSTFFASATSLLPIFAQTILHVGPVGFGFLYAAPSVGALSAGYVLAHIGTFKHYGKVLLIAISVYAIATVAFGFSKLYLLSLAMLFLVGAGDSISTIIRNIIRQLTTPDAIRGRMTSINMIFVMGGPQLGEFEAGALAALVGTPFSVVLGGLGTLLVVGIVATGIPALRNYTHEMNAK